MPRRFSLILLSAVLLALAVQAAPPTAVSLTNPSFEGTFAPIGDGTPQIGGVVANGWQDNSSWASVAVQYSQETNNPHSGSSCQKIAVTSVSSGQVQLIQTIPLTAGSLYTASFWVRGDSGTQAIVEVQQAASPFNVYLSGQAIVTSAWQQVTVQGYVTVSTPAYLMLAVNAPGTIWVDDASVSYTAGSFGPTPNLGPIQPSFFGIHVGNYISSMFQNAGFEPPFVSIGTTNNIAGDIAAGWTDNSSWANVTVNYSEDTDNPHGGVSAQKVDVQAIVSGAVQLVQTMAVLPGQPYTFTAWLRGDPGMTVNMILQDSNAPYTYWGRTAAVLTGAWQPFSVTGLVDDAGVVLLMLQAATPGTFSVDDVTFTGPGGQTVSGGVPWPAARFGTLRLWDSNTSWTYLEPVKGVWNWQPLDTWVAAAQAGGIPDIILTLGQTPAWASSNPNEVNYVGAGAPAPPTDFQDWRDYISAVAQRYRGVIRYYEIWNEPNDPTYYTGTVAQLVELTSEAYTILKAVDPGNTVISPAAYSAGFLDEFLQGGGGQYIDVIGHHFYDTPPEDTGRLIANVRLVMAKDGASSLPLWETEGASGDTTTVPPDLAASYLVRKYLTDLAFGAVRYDWYAWGPATAFCVGTEPNNRVGLTEAGQAYRYLFDWLVGASLTNAVIDPAGNWQIWLTLSGGGTGLIVWNPNQSQAFPIPDGFQPITQRDIFGGVQPISGPTVTVGTAPILLSSCCASAATIGAVVNAASFGPAVSPGSLATIFGTGLAPAVVAASQLPLPDMLDGLSVFINGVPAPLLFVDAGQINFQVPFEAQPGGAVVLVDSPPGSSVEYPVTISAAAPGVFQYGQNHAVATNGLGPLNAEDAPAPAGSFLVVYLTGIGNVTSRPADGAPASSLLLATATLEASASIGGVDAPIYFLGLAPGYAGLAQANIGVPQLPPGDYHLTITVDGQVSAPVVVSVGGP